MKKDYKKFAIKLAKKSGKIILDNFSLEMDKEWKENNDGPVTKIDLAVNKILLETIKKNFPEHGIISEEGSDCQGNEEYKWVCDPIDGTIPFSHGIPICCFSLALVKDGQPILGVVYDPFLKRMFVAEKGKGAFLNNKRIRVSELKGFKNALIYAGIWKCSFLKEMKQLVSKIIDKDAMNISLGTSIYASMLVAAGELVAAITPSKCAHDSAAVKIIVEEAGGKVTNLDGDEQRYDQDVKGSIASNGYLHDEILKLMKD